MNIKGWLSLVEEGKHFLPEQEGWYAVLICFEPSEGFFPDAVYFDGADWKTDRKDLICLRSILKFDNRNAAQDWAYENDPDL